MKKYRRLAGIATLVGILSFGGYYIFKARFANPSIPDLSIRSRGTASAEFVNAQKAVGYYHEQIKLHPEVVKNYVQLAQLFLQEARVTGNHHEYVPKAEYLLNEALARNPKDLEAVITNATLMATFHRFERAKELTLNALDMSPYNAAAYGILVDASTELGLYDEAVKACDKMLSIRPDLRSYSRASYLREIHGDVNGAIDIMTMAANAGVSGEESRAWTLYNLGNLFLHLGKLDTAEFIYKGILEERPNYAYALSGIAQVKCARGDYKSAIDLFSKAAEITPEHVFVEQIADIYRALGDNNSADGTAKIALREFERHEKEGWNVDREFAIFCANHGMHLDEALQRAKREYERRPGNIDVLDTYAWALFRNGKAAEAVSFIQKALRLNSKNSAIHYHAGMIYREVGDQANAYKELQQAVSFNPFIHVLYAESAKSALASMSNLALQN